MAYPLFRLHPLRLLLAILLVPLATGAVYAQDEPSSLFIDRVDVNVVNVEVVVTDRQGRRVRDLTVDDFELYEDGEPVEISNFYTVARADQVVEQLEADRAMLEDRAPRLARPREIPKEQQMNLLVYVDHFNLRPESRKRVLDQLGGFLEDRINQGDNIMLVGYNRWVDVVQPFTNDRELLAQGLRKLEKTGTYRQVDDLERRRILRLLAPEASFIPSTQIQLEAAYGHVRSYVEQARNNLRHSTRALESVVRALAGLPGRKAILYVSDGLPKRPGEDLYQQLNDLYGNGDLNARGIDPQIESIAENEQSLFNKISRNANAHQVTLYTLDARGPNPTVSAAYRNLSTHPGGQRVLENIRQTNLQEPLIDLAESTGGASILNTLNFDGALADLSDDIDSFYSLGYRSRHGGDGKYHKIDVEVKRPGLEARHRSGFVDKPEVERVADRTLSSLLLDLEANPLGIAIDFGEPEKKGRGYLLPMLVRIPFREITLLPSGQVEEGRLKIFLVVQDEEGGVSNLHEIPYPVTVPRDQVAQARDREIGYSTTLRIGAGVPKVAVGVWDELSGTESFVHKRVQVGESKKGKKSKRG